MLQTFCAVLRYVPMVWEVGLSGVLICMTKINFSKYDGQERHPTGPRQASLLKLSFSNVGLPASSSWICYAEQFFECQWTAEDQKVMISSFHCRREAI